jgi:hypothetical protein
MDNLIAQLTGPLGGYVLAIVIIVYGGRTLVQFVREYILDIKVQRDVALAGWKVQSEANAEMADELAARNRLDEAAAAKVPQ